MVERRITGRVNNPGRPLTDLQFVSTAAITTTTTLVVTGLVAGYDYIFQLSAFTPTDDNQIFWMRWSDDAGVSYEEGVADYSWGGQQAGASAVNMSDAQIELSLTRGVGDDAGTLQTLRIELINPNASSEKTTAFWTGGMIDSTGGIIGVQGYASFLQGNDAVDAVQFLWAGGSTFAAQGDITVWRRKRS